MPIKEDSPHINDAVWYEYDASEYIPTNENIKVRKQLFSSDNSFDFGYSADIILCASREVSKRLTEELHKFSHGSTFNGKDYKIELASLYKHKSICKR